MTSKTIAEKTASKFRQKYLLPSSACRQNVFAKHMYGGLKHMQAKMRLVDCVIEVHDARIPFTGRNTMFKQTLYGADFKPHVLVLNKMDLLDRRAHCSRIEHRLFASEPSLRNVIWTDCKRRTAKALDNVMEAVKERVIGLPRYNREYQTEYTLMVIGVPNVGKSSLINAMRSRFANLNGEATPVGRMPGVTKSIMTKITVHENPKIYILDTPGILMPQIGDDETVMKLAVCETVVQNAVGVENIADYVLYFLNKQNCFKYVDYCGLTEPTDSIYNALYHLALKYKIVISSSKATGISQPKMDVLSSATKFIEAFRNGVLGPQFLDWEILNKLENE